MSDDSERRYKACRTCRRQKMRCDGSDGIPCRRCLNARVPCVFDKTVMKRRNSPSDEATTAKRQNRQSLADEVAMLKDQIAILRRSHSCSAQETAEALSIAGDQQSGRVNRGVTAFSSQSGPGDDGKSDFGHTFSPENLGCPVSAVHVMMHPPLDGEPERNSSGWTVENQSKWNREDQSKGSRPDIIDRQLVDESEARELFDLYMHGGNAFLPIFDPLLDTFDSIRQTSPFTLTVILYVAARHQHIQETNSPTLQLCKEEALRYAAESLFQNPCSLETLEAMTILAVHSEKTWFALGHALQMALDLGIHYTVRKIISSSVSQANSSTSTRVTRIDLRFARIWLLLVQYERAIAFGSLRKSRTEELIIADLESFLDLAALHPSAISSCAAIDIFQDLVRLRKGPDLLSTEKFETGVKLWFRKWDSRFEDNGVHKESLQRSHLRIQELYARLIQGGIMFVRVLKARQLREAQTVSTDHDEKSVQLSIRILQLVQDLLTFINNCRAYKRVFSWAPTHEGLLLTFVIILAFQVLQVHPDPQRRDDLLVQVEQTAVLLKQHPLRSFYEVVARLMRLAKSSSITLQDPSLPSSSQAHEYNSIDFGPILEGEDWFFDTSTDAFFHPSIGEETSDIYGPPLI
ncbi:uncharacterized protein PV07_03800 [Cladophialophora immunda]|uniref:Zn(2)-C6 fungal-type domain-containing protein n=1 Tax=Cladophialophora immunda TaxID=569365 RepID=A0A0D2CQI7_9EURO|nr:uncharacterized protein PV07_03800 [Cladophialophora immunda]KIW32240.1 hypothetical protein PV07_03800 [Cladophialophora immunda]